jgi:hypothetical protein
MIFIPHEMDRLRGQRATRTSVMLQDVAASRETRLGIDSAYNAPSHGLIQQRVQQKHGMPAIPKE